MNAWMEFDPPMYIKRLVCMEHQVRGQGIRKFVRCCAKIYTLMRIETVTSNMTCRREQESIGSCVQAITARFLLDCPNPYAIGPRNDSSNGR